MCKRWIVRPNFTAAYPIRKVWSGALEVVDVTRVAGDDHRRILVAQAGEALGDVLTRVRIRALHVREIGRPPQPVGTEELRRERNRLSLVLERGPDVPPHVLARHEAEPGSVRVAGEEVIGAVEEMRDPRDVGLGGDDLERREALEHPAE